MGETMVRVSHSTREVPNLVSVISHTDSTGFLFESTYLAAAAVLWVEKACFPHLFLVSRFRRYAGSDLEVSFGRDFYQGVLSGKCPIIENGEREGWLTNFPLQRHV